MDEDTEVFFEGSGCFLESLMKSRKYLADSAKLLRKLDEVISLELDLAVMGAEKAKSEILKSQSKDNIVRLK